MSVLSSKTDRLAATAWLLGERIEPREVQGYEILARAPFTLRDAGGDVFVLYRFGALVAFTAEGAAPPGPPEVLLGLVSKPVEAPESDDAILRIARGEVEGPDREGVVVIAEAELDRLHVIADVLSRSAFLAHFETQLSASLARLEPLAERLRRGSSFGLRNRRLVSELGEVLVAEMRMVGRVEVSEKPERVWDRPDLDALYVRVADEYEIEHRDGAMTRKLELLGRSSSLLLDLLASRRSLHVEWYIVALILLEIVILVYEIWLQ